MASPIRKTYPITCACDRRHVFDIAVMVEARPERPAPDPAQTWTVQKYCPFCAQMIEVQIPDEPAETGRLTRE